MLIKRKNSMSLKAHSVKKHGSLVLATLALCTAAIAPNAYAADGLLKETVVTVKFKMEELRSENGIEKVYAMLRKRAKSFCRSDTSALYYLNESVSECQEDLVEQFVQSVDIAALKSYHLSQTSKAATEQYALNSK